MVWSRVQFPSMLYIASEPMVSKVPFHKLGQVQLAKLLLW